MPQCLKTFQQLNARASCGIEIDGQFVTVDSKPVEEYADSWSGYWHVTITGAGGVYFEFHIWKVTWDGQMGHETNHQTLIFFT